MSRKAKENIGTIRPEDIKVRKKKVPPVQPHKSPTDYDRKKLKQQDQKDGIIHE